MTLHTCSNKCYYYTRLLGSTLLLTALGATTLSGCRDARRHPIESASHSSSIIEVPFDDSMGKSSTEYSFIFANNDDTARYMKMKAIYEKNLPSKVTASKTPKTPKIIHQIWLGPNIPPAHFTTFQEKWKALHPDWEYHLWSEDDLEKLALDNWDLVEKSQNWAEKADIIRCDLLDRFGGVYLDVDIDPHMSLNELHEKYDFYAGIEYPHRIATTPNRVWVGISIMAGKAGHPIFKNWKRRIRSGWDDVDLRYSSQVERIINHTYFPFTHAVLQEIDQAGNTDILFPATYFYPISASYAAKRKGTFRAFREKLYETLESWNLKQPRPFSRCYPETIAPHYWGNSWIPSPSEQMKETQRLMDTARKDLYKMQQRIRTLEHQIDEQGKRLGELEKDNHLQNVNETKGAASERTLDTEG